MADVDPYIILNETFVFQVAEIWKEFQDILPQLQQARGHAAKIEELKIVREDLDQQGAIAKKEYEKVEKLRETIRDQHRIIDTLESKLTGSTGTSLARLDLLHEQNEHTKLTGEVEYNFIFSFE